MLCWGIVCICLVNILYRWWSSMTPEAARVAILLTLVAQNSAQNIFMRFSFKPKNQMDGDEMEAEPASSTAVMMAELCKLICSIFLQYWNDRSVRQTTRTIRDSVSHKPMDALKMAVPACLYVVQNNLNYVAISNLDGPTFQLLYQLKILTTALFSVTMLKRVLVARQWGALAMLALGVGLIQVSSISGTPPDDLVGETEGSRGQNPLLGLVFVLLACCSSGFAGVYFEKVLKGTSVSLWVRNIQLSTYGVLLGAWCVWVKDWEAVSQNGFFYGYNYAVWMAVVLNSIGGLVVAMVVKYADNVIKGFATSTSSVLTALISAVLFEFQISLVFVVGAYMILHSTFIFSTPPATSSTIFAMTTGTNGMLKTVDRGELELPEKASLLDDEGGSSVDLSSPPRSTVGGAKTARLADGSPLTKSSPNFLSKRGVDAV